ncbi:MAG: hypothetical protein AAGF85_00495 [Bacteroidota bacterium]
MAASKKEIEKCREILHKITDLVPRHYVEAVTERMQSKGWQVPKNEHIQQVRRGNVANLQVMICLQEITRQHWEDRGLKLQEGLS